MALLGASGSGDAALAATACDCSKLALMASRRLAMLHWPRNELASYEPGRGLAAKKEGLPASRFGRLLDLYALSEDYSPRWARRITRPAAPHKINALDAKRRCTQLCSRSVARAAFGRAGTPQQHEPWPPGPARSASRHWRRPVGTRPPTAPRATRCTCTAAAARGPMRVSGERYCGRWT